MDLSQKKLTKEEWCALEVPVPDNEAKILNMIYNGWENPEIFYNTSQSLISVVKLDSTNNNFHLHFYKEYFEKILKKIIKKNNLTIQLKNILNIKKLKIKLKTSDKIRIKNVESKIDTLKNDIYEFILIKILKNYFSTRNVSKKNYYYYILYKLIKNRIKHINIYLLKFINYILETNRFDIKNIIRKSYDYIEKNKYLLKYNDVSLYKHQKEVIKIYKNSSVPSMVLYQAPTGTGKTLTPIALTKGKRVIFVCAAKHIGLQLAKACVSLEIPIAIAFGCEDPGDIRLHYYSAIDYKRNYKTGGIFRVDNSVGDKVEIIICDIQSYLPAMNYMLAFNNKEDIVWYWDEPTITLDYETHEFHELLSRNWNENIIENIVLSSATLPNIEEITNMVNNYKRKFNGNNVLQIKSYECKKSIPMISTTGYGVLPHIVFSDVKQLKASLKHIEKNLTIMRHFSVDEISKCIIWINDNNLVSNRYKIENYFESIDNIDIESIKIYYLLLLKKCKNYEKVYKYFNENKKKRYESTIKITTSDAHTLTDGPTIFLTDNVKKVAAVYLQASKINDTEIDRIMKVINKNEKWKQELEKLIIEDNRKTEIMLGSGDKEGKFNRDKSQKDGEAFKKQMEIIKSKIKTVELQREYIPNRDEHIRKWTNKDERTTECTSDIDEEIIEQIMLLNIENAWKILLLMGIGVFCKNTDVTYMEIMKKLAEEQKLYLIIASSDYIYGTNYQFCHGYIGKDLENLTQEKIIQAFGRIGRRNNQLDYTIRLRSDETARKIFMEEKNKLEVVNMNRLFSN